MLRLLAPAVALVMVTAACGSGSRVGEGIDLEEIEGKGGRAGITQPSPTEASPPPEQTTTTVAQAQASPPPPKTQVMQVFLLANHPYYQLEGSEPGQVIRVPVGVIVRFVSKETEFDRQPKIPALSFQCPRLGPGSSCEFKANTPTGGRVSMEDGVRVFITGQIEVS